MNKISIPTHNIDGYRPVIIRPTMGAPVHFRGMGLTTAIVGNGGDHKPNTRTLQADVWLSEKGFVLGSITYGTQHDVEYRREKVTFICGSDFPIADTSDALLAFNEILTGFTPEDVSWINENMPVDSAAVGAMAEWGSSSDEIRRLWQELLPQVQSGLGYSFDFDAELGK